MVLLTFWSNVDRVVNLKGQTGVPCLSSPPVTHWHLGLVRNGTWPEVFHRIAATPLQERDLSLAQFARTWVFILGVYPPSLSVGRRKWRNI